MIIRNDSELGALLTFAVLFLGCIGVMVSIVLLLSKKFRPAATALLVTLTGVGLYAGIVIVVGIRTPQRIINVGESYCMDIWCISVEKVNTQPRGDETVYKVDVKIFSDANTVKTSAKGAVVYLVDERGRRFDLMSDPSVIPFDTALEPRQSIHTTLSFAVPADAQHLFLPCGYHHIGDESFVPFWVKLYYGNDANYLHKRTMLRVL
jgi:hypothetical protein